METSRAISGVDLGRDGVRLPERLGPFRVQGVLGRGGMGVVLDALAEDGTPVALKLIRPQGDSERAQIVVRRFHREAQILEKLDHPGVVRLVGAGDIEGGVLYLAMARIEGVSLLQVRRKGPVGFEPLVAMGIRIADALAHMHAAGVVHRDIKPANVLINDQGHPIITDFGISGSDEDTGITRQGDLLGSPGFMAPEVIDGALPTEASDQFALGRLLFELGATGPAAKIPVDAPIFEILEKSLMIDWNRLPKDGRWPDLEAVLRRMLADSPRQRFADMAGARDALREVNHSELGDFDTLSEHIDRLEIEPSSAWSDRNAPADDEDFPSIRLSAPRLPAEKAADPLLAHLDKPAGEHSEEATQLDLPPFELIQRSLEKAQPKTRRTRPTDPEVGAPDSSERSTESELPAIELPAEEDRPRFMLGLQANPEPAPSTSARMVQDTTRSPLDPATGPKGEDNPEYLVPKLQKQIGLLREQIAHLRSVEPKRPDLKWTIVGSVLALLAGLGVGLLIPTEPPPIPEVVVTVPGLTGPASDIAQYDTTRGEPRSTDLEEARLMLRQAFEALAKREVESAERYLGLCIEIADLPDCHKTLASIYSLVSDPRARIHFEHYLRVAPSAPDAKAIEKALGGSD